MTECGVEPYIKFLASAENCFFLQEFLKKNMSCRKIFLQTAGIRKFFLQVFPHSVK